MTTMNGALPELLAGNARFAETPAHRGLGLMPSRRLIVVGCADPRVDPEAVLGLPLGSAAVIRNVGGRIGPSTLRTIAQLQAVAAGVMAGQPAPAPFTVVVLHHTDCGITRLEGRPELLGEVLGADPQAALASPFRDPKAAAAEDVRTLRQSGLPPAWTIAGMVYDVETGRVRLAAMSAPTPPPPAP